MERVTRVLPFLLVALVALPARAADQSVTLLGPVGVVTVGDRFTVDVQLSSAGTSINSVELSLRFPTGLLSINDISREGSALTLWPDLPRWDNTTGSLHAVGGIPNGLYAVGARMLTLDVTALASGVATVALDPSSSAVFLNDGQGTRVPLQSAALAVEVHSELTPTVTVTSTTHPDLTGWSRERTVVLDWVSAPDTQYSYAFNHDVATVPDDAPEARFGPLTYPNLQDGRYIFTIKARPAGSAWTPITERWFRIDATAPDPFTLEHPARERVGGADLLTWTAFDAMSGIKRATLTADGRAFGAVTSPVRNVSALRGKRVTVTVADRAGNTRSASWDAPAVGFGPRSGWGWAASAVSATAVAVLGIYVLRRRR